MRLMAASYPSMGSTTGYDLRCVLQPSFLICLFAGNLIFSSFVRKKGDIANVGSCLRFLAAVEEETLGEDVGAL